MVNNLALKSVISESGIKQYVLAKSLGISRQSLSKKLNGETQFTIAEATHLCNELQIPRDQIVNYFFI